MILNPESTFDDVTRLSNSKLELRDFALTKTSDDKSRLLSSHQQQFSGHLVRIPPVAVLRRRPSERREGLIKNSKISKSSNISHVMFLHVFFGLFNDGQKSIDSETTIKWGACSRWSSSLCCPMQISDQMTIETTHSTLHPI